jgi:hypothetical protein
VGGEGGIEMGRVEGERERERGGERRKRGNERE